MIKILDKETIIKTFIEMGYNDVEWVGNRLIFTSGEEVYNYHEIEANRAALTWINN